MFNQINFLKKGESLKHTAQGYMSYEILKKSLKWLYGLFLGCYYQLQPLSSYAVEIGLNQNIDLNRN